MVLRRLVKVLGVGAFFVAVGCAPKEEINRSDVSKSHHNAEINNIDRMVAVEQLILELTPKLKLLSDSLIESEIEILSAGPDLFDEDFRMESVAVADSNSLPADQIKEMAVRVIKGESVTMWSEIFKGVQRAVSRSKYFVCHNGTDS